MPFYDFKKDLNVSKKTEAEVANLLVKTYDAKILGFEETNRYDILTSIKSKQTTYEVKEDFLCEYTGNVGLEFSCRGKPSGIETSQADFYIYKLHTKNGIIFVEHPVSGLKEKISEKKYFRIVNGGDTGSNSYNYLFKLPIFLENGKIIPLTN